MKRILLCICGIVLLFSCFRPALAGNNSSSKGRQTTAPTVYVFDDLNSAAQSYRGDFSFDNNNKPAVVMADLPSKTANSMPTWLSSTRMYRIKMYGNTYLSFPMSDSRSRNGDIVFIRGGESASKVIRNFSSWTHTAMIYNKSEGQTFESQK